MYAQFNRFEIQLTKKQAEIGGHQGKCDDDIDYLLAIPKIKRRLNRIDPNKIRAELKEYGAWDDQELNDIEQNQKRILWIACGNIIEEACHG